MMPFLSFQAVAVNPDLNSATIEETLLLTDQALANHSDFKIKVSDTSLSKTLLFRTVICPIAMCLLEIKTMCQLLRLIKVLREDKSHQCPGKDVSSQLFKKRF